jgi:alkaline phosphatase D
MASGYGIYKRIAKQKLDYMLWMGDNIYLRNGEWNSFEGVCYRYTHTRSLPQMQPLLRATHHIATWDDHDYGMNNGNALSEGRDFALRGFQEFWKNPPTHPEKEKGLYYNYRVGDAEFFLTDDRLCRSPDTMPDGPDKAFLGKVQVEWLLEGLEKSDAHFKIIGVGTQVLNQNLHPRKEGYWKDYRTEATYLLSEIRRRKIEGVLFLTGDVHHTVLSKMETPGFYPLYDLTVSGFTSIQNPFFGRKNGLKVLGTFTWVHNFCVMKFIGSGENRRLRIEIRNKIGARIWKREIFANSLRVK